MDVNAISPREYAKAQPGKIFTQVTRQVIRSSLNSSAGSGTGRSGPLRIADPAGFLS
jgi:hypothetical protein